MRTVSAVARYPRIRREFSDASEIAGIINRSASYVNKRMTKAADKDFTRRDKIVILEFLGIDKGRSEEYFPECLEGER